MGVVHDIALNELRLYTDYGRCCRPLFIVDNLSLKIRKGDVNRLTNDDEFRCKPKMLLLMPICLPDAPACRPVCEQWFWVDAKLSAMLLLITSPAVVAQIQAIETPQPLQFATQRVLMLVLMQMLSFLP